MAITKTLRFFAHNPGKVIRNPLLMLRASRGPLDIKLLKPTMDLVEKAQLRKPFLDDNKASLLSQASFFLRNKWKVCTATTLPFIVGVIAMDNSHSIAGAGPDMSNAAYTGLMIGTSAYLTANRYFRWKRLGALARIMEYAKPLDVATELHRFSHAKTDLLLRSLKEVAPDKEADLRGIMSDPIALNLFSVIEGMEQTMALDQLELHLSGGQAKLENVLAALALLERVDTQKAAALKKSVEGLQEQQKPSKEASSKPDPKETGQTDVAEQLSKASTDEEEA